MAARSKEVKIDFMSELQLEETRAKFDVLAQQLMTDPDVAQGGQQTAQTTAALLTMLLQLMEEAFGRKVCA